MQQMLDTLEDQAFAKDTEALQKFYDSIRTKIEGIDNAEAKQAVIVKLYDNFFRVAFPKMVEQLGIVYTPVEVVDYIVHSVDDILQKEFGRSISDENIHILDPFTGTGTFITRLLQSGLIKPKDFLRKYSNELHANELVLLAYYIAAVNIENAFHDEITRLKKSSDYQPFNGICLTDTFQLGETRESEELISEVFPQNSKRVRAQRKAPLRVIMGNPPYSVGQKSANDNAQNLSYPTLDKRIAETYAKHTNATNKNSLYDSYIKAFRWSADRLDEKQGGIIAFISNNNLIHKDTMSGFRKCLVDEFSSVYVFDLKGAIRGKAGLEAKKEGGNVFDIMTGVSINILVTKPNSDQPAKIYYCNIGDFLKRKEKFSRILEFKSAGNSEMPWENITPDEHNDWLNKRNAKFDTFTKIDPTKKFKTDCNSFFTTYSCGVQTNRDPWAWNFSNHKVCSNIDQTIKTYNELASKFLKDKSKVSIDPTKLLPKDDKRIKWSSSLISTFNRGKILDFNSEKARMGVYRPFVQSVLYFDSDLNHRPYQMPKIFPEADSENLVICVSGKGSRKRFSVILANHLPDLEVVEKSQCFPLYYYEEASKSAKTLFDNSDDEGLVRKDGISDFILNKANQQYSCSNIAKEDIFYYVYGLLHSEDYRKAFSNDLKKSLPRIPLVDDVRDFWSFSKAGRKLADLHINYEQVPPAPGVQIIGNDCEDFTVTKLKFIKKGQQHTIIYNSQIRVTNIPSKAYEYIVNGKSAIEWILDRYQVKTDKKSGITNDPNDWAKEVGNPRYILELLLSVINLSCQTVDIVKQLPEIKFD